MCPFSQEEPQQLQYTREAACCELKVIQESIFRCIIEANTRKDFCTFEIIPF